MRRYLSALLGMSLLRQCQWLWSPPRWAAVRTSRLARIPISRESWKSSTVSLWQTSGPRALAAVEKAYNYTLTGKTLDGLAARFKRAALMVLRCGCTSNPAGIIARASACASVTWGTGRMSERVQRTIREQVGI